MVIKILFSGFVYSGCWTAGPYGYGELAAGSIPASAAKFRL
jgi:hypothetical protein